MSPMVSMESPKMRSTQWAAILFGCMLLVCCANGSPAKPKAAAAGTHRLAPCPNTPNCVSSTAPNEEHYVPPLRYTGNKDAAYRTLAALIVSYPRARIVAKDANYLRAEFRSALFRFVDDVEFVFSPDQPMIDVRSASRVGYSDLGANRRRIEDIRKRWDETLTRQADRKNGRPTPGKEE